jgi:hypothetical protein
MKGTKMKSFTHIILVCVFMSMTYSKLAYTQDNTEPNQIVTKEFNDPIITDQFVNTDLLTVFDTLAAISHINIIYSDNVVGNVNCNLNHVPLSKALEIILAATPYTAKKRDGYYVISNNEPKGKQYEIMGNIGVSGVKINGLPGDVYTNETGYYSAKVDAGFSGKVQPEMEGFKFEPAFVIYNNVITDRHKQDYSAKTISNPEQKNDPLVSNQFVNEDIMTSLNDIASETGINIIYEDTIQGLINCSFDKVPLSKAIEIILAATTYTVKRMDDYYVVISTELEDYKNRVGQQKYKISGTILSDKGEPLEEVIFSSDGHIMSVITDKKGKYSFEVDSGWSGVITPVHKKYTFAPAFMQYSPINREMTNQNYKAQIRMLTISDMLWTDENEPFVGAQIKAIPGDISTVTDSRGQYSIQVPYGWSGEIQIKPPSQPGVKYEPIILSHKNVITDIINGIPVPSTTSIEPAIKQPDIVQTQISKSAGRKVLVVPSESIGREEIIQTKEDINVMAEIFDERFREPRLIEGVLRDFGDFFGRDNKQSEAIYIQGYGVVFTMEVNYQFSSLSQPIEEVKTEPNNDMDQTWEQARQRVFSPETDSTETKSSGREYEKQMVNILKTELIRTLKYASNIRNLQSDEWVIVSVSGSSQSTPISENIITGYGGGYVGSSYGGMMGGYGGGMRGGYGGGAPSPSEMRGGYGYGGGSSYGGMMGGYGGGMMGGYGASPTAGMMGGYDNFRERFFPRSLAANIMTMRVKKSDVDEFANEKIDFEQFREKVQILIN